MKSQGLNSQGRGSTYASKPSDASKSAAKASNKERKIYEDSGFFDMGSVAIRFQEMRENEHKWGEEDKANQEEMVIELEEEVDQGAVNRRKRRQEIEEREERKIMQKGIPDHMRFRLLMSEEDLEMMEMEAAESLTTARWAKFDLFFGMLVALNGMMMGVTTDWVQTEEVEWPRYMESAFLAFFIVEFAIRAKNRRGSMFEFLINPWMAFDLIIISISVTDNWILANIGKSGGASVVAVLRVFRLMRLVRLVRLLKLLKELWLLVSGMMESMRILFWAILMLIFVIYIVALFMQTTVGCPTCKWKDDEHIQEYWGSIPRTMMSLMQIATYDGWGDIVRYLIEGPPGTEGEGEPYLFAILWVFIMISSLGILNLIIGVLLVSALEVTKRDQQYDDTTKRTKIHEALMDLRTVMTDRCKEEGLVGDRKSVV